MMERYRGMEYALANTQNDFDLMKAERDKLESICDDKHIAY
jgi:hypothetical protein